MPYFPQLTSGAVAQFPSSKQVLRRTVVNEAADGSTVKLADPAANGVEWSLKFAGLTDAEWNAIETLFEAVEGQLDSFTFLDPFDNLVSWSEDPTQAVWIKGSGLAATTGLADPLGGTGAASVANSGTAAANLQQSINAPGGYQYCLSVWAQSAAASRITLFQSTATKSASKEFGIGPVWTRLEFGANLGATERTVNFGATVEGGSAVELFGFQVEAQVGASKYRKTLAGNGVYASAWFLDDTLTRTTNGVDDNSCTLRIRASG
jgi:hypothetical protein